MGLALTAIAFAGVAAGFDLYLALLALVALSVLDPLGAPQGAGDMGSWLLLVPAAVLYVTEAIAERRPSAGLVWRQAHVLLRPVGAAALVMLLTTPLSTPARLGSALAAAGLALGVHAVRSGWALLACLRNRDQRLREVLILEDLLVLVLVGVWWRFPGVAFVLAAAPVLLLGLLGPTLLAAFGLSIRLVRGRVLAFLAPPGWSEADDLPEWAGAPRGTPAAWVGYPRERVLKSGWLVVRDRPAFVRRTRKGVEDEAIALDPGMQVSRGPLGAAVICVTPGHNDPLVVVPNDGPGPGQLRAGLPR